MERKGNMCRAEVFLSLIHFNWRDYEGGGGKEGDSMRGEREKPLATLTIETKPRGKLISLP